MGERDNNAAASSWLHVVRIQCHLFLIYSYVELEKDASVFQNKFFIFIFIFLFFVVFYVMKSIFQPNIIFFLL